MQPTFDYIALKDFLHPLRFLSVQKRRHQKPHEYDDAKRDAVPAEDAEAVSADVFHKEVNAVDTDEIGDDHAENQIEPLRSAEAEAMLHKF